MPEGSALHRAQNNGHTWTTEHVLIWHLSWLIQRLESVLVAQGIRRQPKKVPKQKDPWSDDQTKRTGHVEKADQEDAIRYIQSLRAPSE